MAGKKAKAKAKAKAKPKATELVVAKQNEVSTFIAQAIEKNLPIETMEKLFALKERYDEKIAREAFVESMAKFQAGCPIIAKTKIVLNKDKKTTRYKYAPLDTIVSAVKELLGEHGLSYTITVENGEKSIKAICKVTQILGHSETSSFEVPIGSTDFMTNQQAYASALTFSKRYAFCNALGILTGDEDDDAKTGETEKAKSEKKEKEDFSVYEKKLDAAKNLEELGDIWVSIPPKVQVEIVHFKDKLKSKYEKAAKNAKK